MNYQTLTVQAARASNHPDMRKPFASLICTCCGARYKGRQYYNQDTGFSLGPCCVEFCQKRVQDFEATYGAPGVHYNIDFDLDLTVHQCRTVAESTHTALKQCWTTDMSKAAQRCGWDIFQVSDANGSSMQVLKLDAAHVNNGIPVHPTDMHAWTWMLYGAKEHESQARMIMQTYNPEQWARMLAWKVERELYLKMLAKDLSDVACGNSYSDSVLRKALYELKSLKQHSRIKDAIGAIQEALWGAGCTNFHIKDAVVGLHLLAMGKFYEGGDHWGDSQRYEKFIKVAADSVKQLRLTDVERVIHSVVDGNVEGMTRQALGGWIKDHRSDLAREVDDVLEDLDD